MSFEVKAYGVTTPDEHPTLEPLVIKRRTPQAKDVKLDILYCGVCHSDIHLSHGTWKHPDGTPFRQLPAVPGHEIIGRVTEIGPEVTKFQVGDLIGIGVMTETCLTCDACLDDEQQHCNKRMSTYNTPEKYIGGHTFGGYSAVYVTNEEFGFHIPEGLQDNLPAVAPLLCAGITTYAPLKQNNCGPGKKVAIVGLGGLGHMGVKLAAAMGAEVTLFTTSENKTKDAQRLGAHHVVLSTDPEQVKSVLQTFDIIIDCVSADHNLSTLLSCLRRKGNLVLVGLPDNDQPIRPFALVKNNVNLSGSNVGGLKLTQEMLNFCAKHKIFADIEMISMKDINEAFKNVEKSKVKYRYVIDMKTIH